MITDIKHCRAIFWKAITDLMQEMFEAGYEPHIRESQRTPVQAWVNSRPAGSKLGVQKPDGTLEFYPDPVGGVGSSRSLHMEMLAVDIYIYEKGSYVDDDAVYKMFADKFKLRHKQFRWGGDFKTYNDKWHFSMSPDGKRA